MDENNCNCSVEPRDKYDYLEDKLLQMTFWAHQKVLMDKIKAKIEKEEGAKLDRLADLLIQTSKAETEHEKGSEKKRDELRNKLKDYFN
jgi:hypothetical protein